MSQKFPNPMAIQVRPFTGSRLHGCSDHENNLISLYLLDWAVGKPEVSKYAPSIAQNL